MAKVVADMEIEKVVMELPDTKTIRLQWPEGYDIDFLTGQFITVAWPDTPRYRRAYSLSSCALDRGWFEVTVKRDGKMGTRVVDWAKEGDVMTVIQPVGKFLPVILGTSGNFLFIVTIFAENYLNRPFRTHHCNLCARPSEINVSPEMLRRHDIVRATIGFTDNYRHLRHCTFRVSVEQLGSVLDYPAVFLIGTGQKSWYIDQGHNWYVKSITKTNETGRLNRGLNIETSSEYRRLIGN